uniref:Anti-proliferative protein domain-containing protein n=1 Tax=Gouania willdenowi TaxID=441366 RepID=A0A8C5DCW5_GOUWI
MKQARMETTDNTRRMKSEIAAVVSFLKRLVKLKNKVEVEKMDLFAERLTVALQEKFEGHWVPEKPSKGQAYRCIRVNAFHKYDQELLRACSESGVHYGTKTHNYSSLFFRLSIPRFSLLVYSEHKHYTLWSNQAYGSTSSSPLTVTNRKCQVTQGAEATPPSLILKLLVLLCLN